MQDVLFIDGNVYIYKEKKIESWNLYGMGCIFFFLIVIYLVLGFFMDQVVGKVKSYVSKVIDVGKEIIIGYGNGLLCYFWGFEKVWIWDDNKVEQIEKYIVYCIILLNLCYDIVKIYNFVFVN